METGIRALPMGATALGRNFSNLNNLAILRYSGASHGNPPQDPTVNVPVSQRPLVENNLHVSFSYGRLLTMLMFLYRKPLVPSPVVRLFPDLPPSKL
jgi:hypothetical protein